MGSAAIRAARAADQGTIRRMVWAAGINPLSLHWPRFLIAEEDGRVVGIAQIKLHGDGSRELASLAVVPDRQGQGIGTLLVNEWLSRERGSLYLTCRSELEGYYERFGFRSVTGVALPPYFARLMKLAAPYQRIGSRLGKTWGPVIMLREANESEPRNPWNRRMGS